MSLTRKVAFNTIFQIAGKVIVTAISLVVVALLTRYLGVSGYGDYTTVFTYVSFWAILADFGFFWVLVREISKSATNQEEIFNNIITLKSIFGVVVFILCSLLGFLIPQYSWTVKLGIAIISASWFWMSLNSTYVGLFQSKLEMYKAVIAEVLGRAAILIGVLFLIKINTSLYGILWVYIFGNLLNFLISLYFGSKYVKFRFTYNLKIWKYVLKESLPLVILNFIGLIHFRIDTIILSVMKGSLDVGIYGVPSKILEIVILIPGIFMGNVFPILTNYYHSKDKRLSEAIQKSFDFLTIIAMPVLVGLIVLSWPLVDFIAGKEYLNTSTINFLGLDFSAPRILTILAISIFASFFLTIFSNLLTVMEKQSKQVLPIIVITVVNIILNIILIPRYSYLAAAMVNVFTGTVMLVWWNHLTHKYLDYKLNYKIFPKVIFATLIMGAVLYASRSMNVLIAIILGIIVYFAVGYFIKIFDKEMLSKIIALRKEG